MREDFRPYRDEMVISTKAGWDMWPGPYGQGGGGRKYLLSSLDQSLARMGLDYVDIFYSTGSTARRRWRRRWARSTRRCARARRSTSASPPTTPSTPARPHAILSDLGTPLLIHQPSYSMLNRWIEDEGLLDAAAELGIGVIGFTALAQGLLTGRYLDGVPGGLRAPPSGYDPSTRPGSATR